MVPPKSSILIGFSIINHPFWGTPIFGNTHLLLLSIWTINLPFFEEPGGEKNCVASMVRCDGLVGHGALHTSELANDLKGCSWCNSGQVQDNIFICMFKSNQQIYIYIYLYIYIYCIYKYKYESYIYIHWLFCCNIFAPQIYLFKVIGTEWFLPGYQFPTSLPTTKSVRKNDFRTPLRHKGFIGRDQPCTSLAISYLVGA